MPFPVPRIPRISPAQIARWRSLFVEWGSLMFLILVIVVPLGMFCWLLLFTDTFVVRTIHIEDVREHTTREIESRANEYNGKSIFSVETLPVEQRLLSDIPQLKQVLIIRKLPNTLKIVAQEKEPAVLLLSQGSYYLVDQDGIAYEQARLDTLPGTVLPIVKSQDQQANVQIGAPALSTDFITFTQEAHSRLADVTGSGVVEVNIPSLAAREVHFRLENNWLVKLDTTRPLSQQLDILSRLLGSTISEEDRAGIDYIDLRIPNRIYYKLQ